jgi:hypothetical protein
LCGVLTASSGAVSDDSLPICNGDVASLVLGLDRLDGGGDEALGGAASPGAFHLLVQTMCYTKDNSLWNGTSFAANAGGSGKQEDEGRGASSSDDDLPTTTTALHRILAVHLASSPSGNVAASARAMAERLSQVYDNATDASSWIALGTVVACCLVLRFSHLVDPNASIPGWAHQQQHQQEEDQQQQKHPKGSTLTTGAMRSLSFGGSGSNRGGGGGDGGASKAMSNTRSSTPAMPAMPAALSNIFAPKALSNLPTVNISSLPGTGNNADGNADGNEAAAAVGSADGAGAAMGASAAMFAAGTVLTLGGAAVSEASEEKKKTEKQKKMKVLVHCHQEVLLPLLSL